MQIFEYMENHNHEQVVFCHDAASGLKAIIAIHDTTLGPALGGCRMWNYENEEEALLDVLRLSEGMTYKNSAMGLNYGGGKSVILADPKKDKSEALFRAFGRFVQSLNGRYYTAEDVSINTSDMMLVAQETDFVLGLPGRSGDPSPFTAYGVFCGMQACIEKVFDSSDFKGLTVAIQGAGHVGYYLAQELHDRGAKLIVTDIDDEKVQRVVDDFGAQAVAPGEIYSVECDIFAPCALGAVINDETIPALKCKIVAGSANNQLQEARHGDILREHGILYAPDYVINGGGVINVSEERADDGYHADRARRRVGGIYDKVKQSIEISEREDIPTNEAADRMAESRIKSMARLQDIYIPSRTR